MANVTDTFSQENFPFFKEYKILGSFIYNVWVCTISFGITSNIINIVVFVKTGVRDNVTLSLLVLSISDLFSLLLSSPTVVKRFMDQNTPNHTWTFDPIILEVVFYWYAYTFYDYSSFISVFLGIVRCACVAKPLLFKSMFTMTRTSIILAVLFVVATALRVPVLTIFSIGKAVNPRTNATWFTIRVANNFIDIYTFNDIINRNIVSWIAYIIAVACVTVLVMNLQAASRFRHSLASQTGVHKPTESHKSASSSDLQGNPSNDKDGVALHDKVQGNKDPKYQVDQSSSKESSKQKDKAHSKMSARDVQVVRSVTLICVIFILSQLPFQVVSTIRLVDPDFSSVGSKRYGFSIGSSIANTCKFLNSSINIFVHYFFNSRYRDTFLNLLCKKPA